MGKVQRSRSRSGVDSEAPVDPAKPKAPPRAELVVLLLAGKSWRPHTQSPGFLLGISLCIISRITCDRDPEFH